MLNEKRVSIITIYIINIEELKKTIRANIQDVHKCS